MKAFRRALLASSVLTTVGSGASAATLLEDAGGFPDSPPGSNIDFTTFQTVQGTLTRGSDSVDYFTFTGLTAGADFSITLNRLIDGCGSCVSFVFTADGFSETLAPGASKTDIGVLGATSLTVGVTNPNSGTTTIAEGYSVTLSEIPAGVPGRSAAALFAVGLAGLAAARRRRRR